MAMSRDSLTRWLNSFTERVSFRALVMEGNGRSDLKSGGDNGSTSPASEAGSVGRPCLQEPSTTPFVLEIV